MFLLLRGVIPDDSSTYLQFESEEHTYSERLNEDASVVGEAYSEV